MKFFNPPQMQTEDTFFCPTISSELCTSVNDGIVHSSSVDNVIDPLKVNEGLKVQDFSLSVLLANGAADLLGEVAPIQVNNTQILNTFNNI